MDSNFKNLRYGLRPGVVKENPELYRALVEYLNEQKEKE